MFLLSVAEATCIIVVAVNLLNIYQGNRPVFLDYFNMVILFLIGISMLFVGYFLLADLSLLAFLSGLINILLWRRKLSK